jgi:DNA-binding MarR family transcriptional regulator
MRLKPSPSSPEAGAYAGLSAALPAAIAGHAAGRRPRGLSELQRRGLLGTAAARVAEEARDRKRRWLRRLDTIHVSGCRTKRQRWEALAALAEPMLARLDLATLALGWLDENGAFRLNRQRGLAQDTGLTESRVSRTLSALQAAGYVRRRVRRIFKNGLNWVTRVTIHLRPRFFIDLGLGHQLAEARTRKKAKREARLREVTARLQRDTLQELGDAQVRRQSHRKAQGIRQNKVVKLEEARELERNRIKAEAFHQLAVDHPELSATAIRSLLEQRFPPAK